MNFQSYLLTGTAILLTITLFATVIANRPDQAARQTSPPTISVESTFDIQQATFGTGCFWCTEAVFESIDGVISVDSGYSGGHVDDPTYKQVCNGTTGHAEVVHIKFDANKVSFEKLLQAFWLSHDPTTLNRQGADVGTQYRSVVFYHNNRQKVLAHKYKSMFNESGAFEDPIVTEITKFETFYKAENYHQDYFEVNGHNPYCLFNISPKLKKFKKAFKALADESQVK